MQHAFISTSYRYAHKKYQSQLTSSSTIRLEVANHNTPTVNTTSRSTEMLSRSQNNPKPLGVELRSTRHAINCRSSPAGFFKNDGSFWD